jgi:DNA-binding transcriptional ArsR family regulator
VARPAASTDVFRAVADPTRRAIIDLLARGDRSAGSLAQAFDLCQSTVSEHLAVLRRVGLVGFEESGGRRIYRLHAEPLREIVAWAGPVIRTIGRVPSTD